MSRFLRLCLALFVVVAATVSDTSANEAAISDDYYYDYDLYSYDAMIDALYSDEAEELLPSESRLRPQRRKKRPKGQKQQKQREFAEANQEIAENVQSRVQKKIGAVMDNHGKLVPETGWFPVSGSSGSLNLPTLQTRSASKSEPRAISYGDDWRRAPLAAAAAAAGSRKPTAAVNSFSPYRDVAKKANAASEDEDDMAQVASSRIGVLPGSFVSNSNGQNKRPPSGPVPPPITVFPNDTIVIHYATLDLEATQRNQRSTPIPGAGTIEKRLEVLFESESCLSFDPRTLIVDLLKAPLRVRAQIAQRLQEQLDASKRQPKTIVANTRAESNGGKSINNNSNRNNGGNKRNNNRNNNFRGSSRNSGKVNSAKAVVSSQFSNFPNFEKTLQPNTNADNNRNNRNQKPQPPQQQQQQQQQPKKQALTKIPAQQFIESNSGNRNKAGRTSLNTHPPATSPPRTQPPRTQPPRTQTPRTQPPRTQPPRTKVPRTQPPRTERPRTQRPSTQAPKAASSRAQKSPKQGTRSGRTRTIQQFLEIYPEVRRVSSKFGENQVGAVGNLQPRPKTQSNRQQKAQNGNNNSSNRGGNGNRGKKDNRNNGFQPNTFDNNDPDLRKKLLSAGFVPARPQSSTTRRQPPRVTTTTAATRRPRPTKTTTTRRPPPKRTTTRAPSTPSPPRQQQLKQQQQQKQQPAAVVQNSDYTADFDYYGDGELSSDEYSYLYYQDYYDELVPKHHRFDSKNKSSNAAADAADNGSGKDNRKNKSIKTANGNNNADGSFNVFISQPKDSFPNFPNKQPQQNQQNRPRNKRPKQKKPQQQNRNRPQTHQQKPTPPKKPQAKKAAKPAAAPVITSVIDNTAVHSGPFGYTDKGSFFSDMAVTEFPKWIEVIYQGFVWAIRVTYPSNGSLMHGGVHTILKDKVKKKKIFLKDGEHIVRISGRASPYNINRFTVYTSKGTKYGPFGDRRSEDSTDFDVSAPPGHALAYISGTVDFGVPLRSVSLHWRPYPG